MDVIVFNGREDLVFAIKKTGRMMWFPWLEKGDLIGRLFRLVGKRLLAGTDFLMVWVLMMSMANKTSSLPLCVLMAVSIIKLWLMIIYNLHHQNGLRIRLNKL